MGKLYQPGYWAKKYKRLPRPERDRVNQQTNRVFAKQTGVTRKLDPRRDQKLCAIWLQLRDEVVSGKHAGSRFQPSRSASRLVSTIGEFASSTTQLLNSAMEFGSPQSGLPWMDIARAEHRKGVKEIEGKKHNPEVMKYIRSCPDLYATENKSRYTEREGEEGVKWCSAFVNWCMSRAGIRGTNNARALSWTRWGKALSKPRAGAVVVTKGSKYRHVAFVEEVDGRFKMLGGNQRHANGKGDYNQVSINSINKNIVVAYRWPSNWQL